MEARIGTYPTFGVTGSIALAINRIRKLVWFAEGGSDPLGKCSAYVQLVMSSNYMKHSLENFPLGGGSTSKDLQVYTLEPQTSPTHTL